MKKVLVGLSGGVDSALCARILLERGYEVTGCYLSLCPDSDPAPARKLASRLGIPFVTVEAKKSFRTQVIEPFLAAYGQGRTPNPCVECNRSIKIALLLRTAKRMGIPKVATGHYARIGRRGGRYVLLPGKDEKKDQSYFLWKLTQDQLSQLIFPLGDRVKEEVKEKASDLVPKKQKESMEICFIPDRDTPAFLEREGVRLPPGEIRDEEGRLVGHHEGLHRYTVGQRRGLGVAAGERIFVTRLEREKSLIRVGPETALYTREMRVEKLHFLQKKSALGKGKFLFRGRHRAPLVPCEVHWEGRGARLLFSRPVKRISPGQSAVFYRNGALLFGGVIGE